MITIAHINAGKLTHRIRLILIKCGNDTSDLTRANLYKFKPALKEALETRLDEIKTMKSVGSRTIKVFAEWCGAKLPDEKKPAGLRTQVAALKKAMEKLAVLGNGNRYGISKGNIIARDSLTKIDGLERPYNYTREEALRLQKESKQ